MLVPSTELTDAQPIVSENADTTGFRDCWKKPDTTGFSRVVLQFLTYSPDASVPDTTAFRRVEFHLQPLREVMRSKLKLHVAEASGVLTTMKETVCRSKLKDHAAEAGGVRIFTPSSVRGIST